MRIIAWIRVGIMWLRELRRLKQASNERAHAVENGTYSDAATIGGREFDERYRSAMRIVQYNIDEQFPDRYYAIQRSNYDQNIDYVSLRIDAIGRASNVISTALKKGATITQAAKLAEFTLLDPTAAVAV